MMRRAAPTLFIICLLSAPDAATAKHSSKGARPRNYSPAANPDDTNTRATGPPPLVAPRAAQGRTVRRKGTRRRVSPPKSAPPKPVGSPAGGAGGQQQRPVLREDVGTTGQTARPPGKSDDELAADAFSSALNDALRKPLGGETRARGVLARVECDARGLVFVVREGSRLLRLSGKSFDEIHIMAFTPEAGGELACGPRKPESQVVVTYRAGADARARTDGAITALEFVPADFQLRQ